MSKYSYDKIPTTVYDCSSCCCSCCPPPYPPCPPCPPPFPPCCCCKDGKDGKDGAPGAPGKDGKDGKDGVCTCACLPTGELAANGGMEAFTGDIPTGWTTTTSGLVCPQDAGGRVHSGNYSVNISKGGNISQVIPIAAAACYYKLSLFVNASAEGVGLVVTVNFVTPGGDVPGGTITVRATDIPNNSDAFSYYRMITSAAPLTATGARITISVPAGTGGQSLNIDDVSFGI